ncbi:Hypothetical protein NTJ_09347 [Nesidiocoris tenuis]|uniref:Osiris 16 n=1 Tax=Nesidiocoris tenuis TaxID=355587 RepID=A0ABN7AWH1_9HEMI|nr:Hypothetical protein NTJ_09347 [Nesidiocoris tenuis]
MNRCSTASFLLIFLASSVFSAERIGGNLKVISSSLDKCSKLYNWENCLKMKAISMLDDAVSSPEPVIFNDYVSLVSSPEIQENDTESSEAVIERALEKGSVDEKAEILDGMIADRMARFFTSRSIQLTIPTDIAVESGRKKDKKGNMLMMAAIAMGGMMIQMMMGKVAILAGKALLVGKMALLLSGIIALKKLVGGGGGESHHPQVVYATEAHSGGGGGGWGRRFFNVEADKNDIDAFSPTIITGPDFMPYTNPRDTL